MNMCAILQREVQYIGPTTSIEEAARLMHDRHTGVLPVVENDTLVGMITEQGICCKVTARGRDTVTTQVGEVMIKDITTFTDRELSEAAYLLANRKIRRIAVLDNQEKLAGMLANDDPAGTLAETSTPVH